ncbi:MAG: 2-phosphosulfolactate phosphatase [Phycisphaerales bacterium]|jgi:2-phosphosulfolactate phosphatase|nr:2-phosphosulfolactate phosphatase [Phycisphaerales bacterium]
MTVDVVALPRELKPGQLKNRACVVFDVLRATTTMAAALHAGVEAIHLFDNLDAARAAAEAFGGPRLLCGEAQCVAPAGFDLGNSPGQFRASHRGATMFMCTTNGTRALLAAREAAVLFTGAIVNASAVAEAVRATGRDVTLLCAGTNDEVAPEDLIGAGAVIAALSADQLNSDGKGALSAFRANRHRLAEFLSETAGGRNVRAAGLDEDIAFAARLDAVPVVGMAAGDPLVVTRA